MACRVTWSPQALADIEAIAAFIEQDSPFYARAVVTRIVAIARQIAQFPLEGRIVPEMRDASIRELFVFSYRVIYRVEGESATVVAVIHGKRLLETEN
ncbi:MAG: type II toxin-antitoxin system RelE/ParE family toxin [Desulfuromonadales bacterium]